MKNTVILVLLVALLCFEVHGIPTTESSKSTNKNSGKRSNKSSHVWLVVCAHFVEHVHFVHTRNFFFLNMYRTLCLAVNFNGKLQQQTRIN